MTEEEYEVQERKRLDEQDVKQAMKEHDERSEE